MTGSEGETYEHPTQKCPLYTSGKIVYRCRNAAWSLIKERCVPDAPKDFSYASVDNEWLINKAIVTLTPSVKCYECKFLLKKESGQVNPPVLPAGITLDATDGTISGTPTELMEKSVYTIIARNDADDAEVTISMLVTSEKGNTVMWVLIIIFAALIIGVIALCLFFRIRGTGRNTHKARALKAAAASKTNRV